MAKKFDTEPDTPGDDGEIESLIERQLQQKIALLELKIKDLEAKIDKTLANPAFKTGFDPDDLSWIKNEKSLGRIAGTIPNPIIGLKERLDDDAS